MKSTTRPRTIAHILDAVPTSDGAGVRIQRIVGTHQPNLDPFLMLDEFRSDTPDDYRGGFPAHPHRGFQTVTYMLEGRVRHQDSRGNSGLLRSGGVQWMNAGRGVIHSEMPEQENGLMWGFQLWVNLPAAEKMSDPAYQEFDPAEIPVDERPDGTSIRVIAGRTDTGIEGAVRNIVTQPLLLDIRMNKSGHHYVQSVPAGHTAMLYVYDGDIEVEGQVVQEGRLALLKAGDQVSVSGGTSGARFLLIAGAPIGEPIEQRGPFVMNTLQEIQQAFEDYSAGRFA